MNVPISHRASVNRRGVASVWILLVFVTLFLFLAMAVDVLWTVMCARQLSAGADASALAGALYVRRDPSMARDKAVNFAAANTAGAASIQIARNDANAPTGDLVIGRYDRQLSTFTTTTTGPNAVLVRARRTDTSISGPLPMIFASITGVNTTNVDRYAIAMLGGDIGAGVIVLNPTDSCALDMRGSSGLLRVNDGAVMVNSNHGTAACDAGNPTIDTAEMHVVGGVPASFAASVTGEIFTDRDYVPDPLAALPEPNAPTVNRGDVKVSGNSNVTLQPGRYGKLEILNGNVTLAPGLYYITKEFSYNGGNVDGTAGVMLFIAAGGKLDVSGNGQFRIAGMSPTAYPDGPLVPGSVANVQVPIFQSRSNTTTAEMNGTSDWTIDGTIYTPKATLLVRGTNGNFANGIIADKLHTRGNESLRVDYEDQFPKIPPFVFLVE